MKYHNIIRDKNDVKLIIIFLLTLFIHLFLNSYSKYFHICCFIKNVQTDSNNNPQKFLKL